MGGSLRKIWLEGPRRREIFLQVRLLCVCSHLKLIFHRAASGLPFVPTADILAVYSEVHYTFSMLNLLTNVINEGCPSPPCTTEGQGRWTSGVRQGLHKVPRDHLHWASDWRKVKPVLHMCKCTSNNDVLKVQATACWPITVVPLPTPVRRQTFDGQQSGGVAQVRLTLKPMIVITLSFIVNIKLIHFSSFKNCNGILICFFFSPISICFHLM